MSVLAMLSLIKALHVVFMVAWFAGMFFLGRMVIYLSEGVRDNQPDVVALMDKAIRRVSRIIVWPSTVMTVGLGLWLMVLTQAYVSPWFHLKMTLVVVLLVQQHYVFRLVKQLRRGDCRRSSVFLRVFNEVPFFLLLGIVLTVYTRDTYSGVVAMVFLFCLVGLGFGIRGIVKKKRT